MKWFGFAVLATLLVSPVLAAEDVLVRWKAGKGNDAVLRLEADDGAAADVLELIMGADGVGKIDVGGLTLLTLDPAVGEITSASATAAAATVTTVTHPGPINKTVLTVADHVIIIDGSSGAGWGATNLATLAQGYIHILGVKVDDLSMTADGGDVVAGEGGDFALGTTGTEDNSLATTEVNLLASTSLDPIQTAVDAVQVVDIVPLDGTAAGTPIYLNMLMDDADVAGPSTNTVDATITLWWVYMGDN